MKIALFKATPLEGGGGLERNFIGMASSLSSHPDITIDIITMDDRFSEKIEKLLNIYYFKNDSALYNLFTPSVYSAYWKPFCME